MIVAFFGTRHGMTDAQSDALLSALELYEDRMTEFHHLGSGKSCRQAHDIALAHLDVKLCVHPETISDAQAYSRTATLYPVLIAQHSRDWLATACGIAIAAPASDERLRSLTWIAVRRVRWYGKPLFVIRPDGIVEVENDG